MSRAIVFMRFIYCIPVRQNHILLLKTVNIESLETEASAAPWTSRMTFHLTARITLPESCPVEKLREELRELERQRNLDIIMKADKSVSCSPV